MPNTSGPSARTVRAVVAMVVAITTAGSMLYAQQIWVGGGRGRGAPKWATLKDFDGSFVYCRGHFNSIFPGEEGGSGWNTDYPGADYNFSVRLAELTRVPVRFDDQRNPNFAVVALNDPLLFKCPILFMEDVGVMALNELEIQNLRDFLLKGGFLWVDDFWGTRAWRNWVGTIGRVLSPSEFPIFDIPPDHPIMQSVYDVKAIPQVANISFWRRTGGETSERFEDSAQVHWRGIQDETGRLMVVMSHNTDIADTWEREGGNVDFFELFSPTGYAVGVNVVIYAMTH